MSKQEQGGRAQASGGQRIYELEVSLLDGRTTPAYNEANPVVSRTIQIRGNQTLETLHEAIFKAFGRDDEHMYEFQVGVKKRMDPKARRYVMPEGYDPFEDPKPAGLVTRTTLDALDLRKRQMFLYWFDFGDDWWHEIRVVAIHDGPGSGQYPRVTARIGEDPPQYPGWGDEDDDDDEDDQDEADQDEGDEAE